MSNKPPDAKRRGFPTLPLLSILTLARKKGSRFVDISRSLYMRGISFSKQHPFKLDPKFLLDIFVLIVAIVALIASYQANRIAQQANIISDRAVQLYVEENSMIREANDLTKQAEQRGREEAIRLQREKWYRTALEFAPKGRIDSLRAADLRDLDLSGVDLSGADLLGANLSGATLDGANLSETLLIGADFTNASLVDAQLQIADLSRTIFRGATLVRAKVDGAYLTATELQGTDLTGVNLEKAIYPFIYAPRVYSCSCSLGSSCISHGSFCGPGSLGTCTCEQFTPDGEPINFDERTIWPSTIDSTIYSSPSPNSFVDRDYQAFFRTFYTFKLVHAKRAGNLATQRFYLGELGDLFFGGKYYQEAVKYYNEALNLVHPLDDPVIRAEYLDKLGQVYLKLNDPESATKVWEEAVVIYQASGRQVEAAMIEMRLYETKNAEE